MRSSLSQHHGHLAVGFALALALAAGSAFGAPDPGSGQVSAPATVAPSQHTCQADASHVAQPDQIPLSGRTTVSLTLRADCANVQLPVHVALVFDNSVAMAGTRMNFMKVAVGSFVDALDFDVARVGLASYYVTADLLAPLSTDPDMVKAAAQRFYPRQGSNLTMGIRAGRMILEQGRNLAVVPDPEEVMILLVGSMNDEGAEEAEAEAQAAKDAGITIVTIAAGAQADPDSLEAIASSASLFYSEGTGNRWPALFQRLASDIGTVRVTGATVTSTLSDSFDYVFGSGFPAPRLRGRELSWQFAVWPPEGIVIEYQLEGKAVGRAPISQGAAADLTLDRGLPQHLVLPVPDVEVFAGPTATPPPATATPQPSPTVDVQRAYLPVAGRAACMVLATPLDAVLVVDTSASMLTEEQGGLRMDHALDGGARFLDGLRYPVERGGVVAFSDEAQVLAPMSSNRGALVSALGLIYAHVGRASRMDAGLAAAYDQLSALAPDPGRRRVVVVLSDGGADHASAAAAAQRVRGAATLATVALGPDAEPGWLAQLATPGWAMVASVAEGLPVAFETLLDGLHCGIAPAP